MTYEETTNLSLALGCVVEIVDNVSVIPDLI